LFDRFEALETERLDDVSFKQFHVFFPSERKGVDRRFLSKPIVSHAVTS